MKTIAARRKNEGGQAISELVISLIGITIVFLGMLLIAGLGIENIKTVISARGEADKAAAQGTIGDFGDNILEWKNRTDGQGDEIPFTKDDYASKGTMTNGGVFTAQLADNTGEFSLAAKPTIYYNFAPTLIESDIFTSAATLTGQRVSVSDPLTKIGLRDAKQAIKSFIMNPDVRIEETVYMPIRTNF